MKNAFAHIMIFFVSLIAILLFSIYVQSAVLLSWDVSWGLHESRRLLSGGIYGKEIFEASPPIFLYLYAPVIWLTHFTHLSNATALRIYADVLSLFSLALCYISIKKIFADNQPLKTIVLISVAALFILLPLPYDTGQREHLFLILVFPYILHIAATLTYPEENLFHLKSSSTTFKMTDEKQKLSSTIAIIYRILIAFSAGLGFAIKPFFILPFLLLEIFYVYQKRNLLAFFRIETCLIVFITLLQIVLLYLLHPDYFKTIAPLFMHFYYQGYSSNWLDIVFHPAVLFCVFVILFFIAEYKHNPYRVFSNVLCITMSGFLVVYFTQRTFWYYHLYPAFAVSMMLVVFLYCLFVKRVKQSFDYLVAALLSLFLFTILIANTPDFYISYVGFQLASGIFFLIFILFTAWLIFLSQDKMQFKQIAFVLFFGLSIFTLPFHFSHTRFLLSVHYKQNMRPLIAFLKTHAKNKPVYFFTSAMSNEFPAVDYAKAIPASRYPALIWLPGLLNQTHQTLQFSKQPELEKVNRYFIASVTDEIQRNKPDFIFVDETPGLYLKQPFSYLDYFLTDADFKHLWQSYQYVITIDGGDYFRFNVYQHSLGLRNA